MAALLQSIEICVQLKLCDFESDRLRTLLQLGEDLFGTWHEASRHDLISWGQSIRREHKSRSISYKIRMETNIRRNRSTFQGVFAVACTIFVLGSVNFVFPPVNIHKLLE